MNNNRTYQGFNRIKIVYNATILIHCEDIKQKNKKNKIKILSRNDCAFWCVIITPGWGIYVINIILITFTKHRLYAI